VEIDGRISQANGRLKSAKVGVAIERQGDRLWLKATLPHKPSSSKDKSYWQILWQKISLGARATPAGLQHAEKRARLLGAELNLGKNDAIAEWVKGADVVTAIANSKFRMNWSLQGLNHQA
jgi:hypothetical protein